MELKSRNVYLGVSLFFVLNFIIHAIGISISNNYHVSYLIADSILALLFLLLYKTNKIKLENVITIMLIGWSCMAMVLYTESQTAYSVTMAYSVMIVIKNSKHKIRAIILSTFFLIIAHILSITLNDMTAETTILNIMLSVLFALIHYYIYQSNYHELPDIKTKYHLTNQEMLIIECLFKKDPSNKNIASQLILSESTVKADLGIIYKKLGILSGGSKKAELVSKLAIEGFSLP